LESIGRWAYGQQKEKAKEGSRFSPAKKGITRKIFKHTDGYEKNYQTGGVSEVGKGRQVKNGSPTDKRHLANRKEESRKSKGGEEVRLKTPFSCVKGRTMEKYK